MNAEDKAKQIEDTITEIEGEELTYEEEFKILFNVGVEYELDNGDILVIPCIKLKDQIELIEVEKLAKEGKQKEVVYKNAEIIAKITGKTFDYILDNLDASDMGIISNIMMYSVINGKRGFRKKSITLKEIIYFREMAQAITKNQIQ